MMYELKIYVKDDVHFLKVDDSGLEILREELDDDTAPNYTEVYCFSEECTFAVRRDKVLAYSYKEVSE